MKKLYFDTLILALLLMVALPTEMRAQDETTANSTSTTLVKSTPSEVAATTDDDAEAIVLVNVATSERINFGGTWGSQPMIHEVGMPLYLVSGTETASGDSEGTYYKIGTNTYPGDATAHGYLGYMRNNGSSNVDGADNGLFVDRTGLSGYDGIVRMIFTSVGNDSDGYPIYNIGFKYQNNNTHDSNGDWSGTTSSDPTIYYLVATGDDNAVVEACADGGTLSDGTTSFTLSGNTYAQWQIVSKSNLIKYFASANDNWNTETAQATFLIDDQNFNRKNKLESSWTKSSTTSVTIGNGLDAESTYQRTYGEYWVARIDGEGSIYQEIEVPSYTEDDATEATHLAGWYQVRIKGFSTGDTPAQAFISYGAVGTAATETNQSYTAVELNQLAAFATETASVTVGTTDYAEILMKYDEELLSANSTYETDTYAMVYIPEGITSFYIGVQASSGSGITIIDDIQLYYAGNDNPLVLKEDWTSDELSYINNQVDTEGRTRTLLLQRTLVQEQWNSLILPVDLTYSQVKGVFGEKVQLCVLDRTENSGADIYFTSVLDGLADTGVAINRNTLYIIKPSELTLPTTSATYYLDLDNNGTAEEHTLELPYYSIPLVAFTATVSATVEGDVKGSNRDNGIKMQGTYVVGTVPQYSYAISSTDGLWYYLTTSSTVTSKGYRAWILTNASTSQTKAANVFIDETSITDGIAELQQDLQEQLGQETLEGIYSLSGQKVSASGSLNGLPKGIYIKNGKKYVVK